MRVLMLTSTFPPVVGAGTRRPAAFARHLADAGFAVTVVTLSPDGHAQDPSLLRIVPDCVRVERVALHASGPRARRLLTSLRPITRRWPVGRWRLRWPPVVQHCRRVIARERPEVLWATGPHFEMLQVAAHLGTEHRIPFVADYRDPWSYGFMSRARGPLTAWFERAEEKSVLSRAHAAVFTSAPTADRYRRLYPCLAPRITVVCNGFESDQTVDEPRLRHDGPVLLRYVGRLGEDRRPDAFLHGLRLLLERRPDLAPRLAVRFTGECDDLAEMVATARLGGVVRLEGPVPYDASLRLMRDADALLLLQTLEGPGSDVISGKVYEYLAARRPILGVVSADGGDAWLLRQSGVGVVTGLEPAAIAAALAEFVERPSAVAPAADPDWLRRFEWRSLTAQLVHVLEDAAQTAQPAAAARQARPQ